MIIGIRGLGGLVFGFLGASDALRGGVSGQFVCFWFVRYTVVVWLDVGHYLIWWVWY